MKHNFILSVDIVYVDLTSLPMTYSLTWDDTKDFEIFMNDVMNTIAIAEAPGHLDRIDIKSIDFPDKNKMPKDAIDEVIKFKKDNAIK